MTDLLRIFILLVLPRACWIHPLKKKINYLLGLLVRLDRGLLANQKSVHLKRPLLVVRQQIMCILNSMHDDYFQTFYPSGSNSLPLNWCQVFKINHQSDDKSLINPLEAKSNNETTKVSACFNNDYDGTSEKMKILLTLLPQFRRKSLHNQKEITLLSVMLIIPIKTLI